MSDGGWEASARAWIERVDQGEPNRELLLDHVMLALCGDPRGLLALDAGCGEGRFVRKLAARGATVVGLDRTRLFVDTAFERRTGGQQFARGLAERLPFADNSFDLVVSYVMLVDIADFRAAIREMARVLAPGGWLVVSNVSFMSAGASTSWIRDEEGRRLYYPIDRYLEERSEKLSWCGIEVENWHRPLEAYMEAYLRSGLILREFFEPRPVDDSLRDDPRFEDWYRVPNFTAMRWEKAAQ